MCDKHANRNPGLHAVQQHNLLRTKRRNRRRVRGHKLQGVVPLNKPTDERGDLRPVEVVFWRVHQAWLLLPDPVPVRAVHPGALGAEVPGVDAGSRKRVKHD